MAEEGNLGLARALETDGDSAVADHQRREVGTREATPETGIEVNDNVVNYQDTETRRRSAGLDWREQVRNHPVAYGVGALGLGILVGYGLAGLIEGEDEPDFEGESDQLHSAEVQYKGGGPSAFTENHSYAAHARAIAVSDEQVASELNQPGLVVRFKETRAYDRLREEVSDLGSRFMDELVHVARSIVLPAIFGKLKEVIAVDRSNKRPRVNSEAEIRPIDESPHVADAVADNLRSESGKSAYPNTKPSLSKFDRLESDRPAMTGDSNESPHINLNYDDRYERESKLFSRGENKGFVPAKPAESKPSIPDTSSSENNDKQRGGDYTYDAENSA